MRRSFLIGIVILLLILWFVPIQIGYKWARDFSTDPNCFDVKRPRYLNRHFKWSGIFPVEGGFISDPHFNCSETEKLSLFINEFLKLENGRYQIIDVNPYFEKDKFREVLLVLGDDFNKFEFRIANYETPQVVWWKNENVLKVGVYIFPVGKKLGVYRKFSFTGSVPGFYIIDVPLRNGGISAFYDLKTPQAQEMISYLKEAYPDLKIDL